MSSVPLSHAHIAAIRLPESANGSFRNPALAAAGLAAAHFKNRLLIRCAGDAALNEATDATILHGDVARGPNEIALLDAGQSLFGRVVGETDIGPVEISLVDRARNDLPDRDGVLNLLQNECRKHRQYLQRDAVVIFLESLQQRWVGELVLTFRAQLLLGVFCILLGFAIDGRIADVVAAALVDDNGTLLRKLVQLERREEQVQNARMVGVLDVLHVELPVVGQNLCDTADDNRGSTSQDAFDAG